MAGSIGVYDLRDQGSIIAGVLALFAGGLAYRIGRRQIGANESRDNVEDNRRRYAAAWMTEREARRIIAAASGRISARTMSRGSAIRMSKERLLIVVTPSLRSAGAGIQLLPRTVQTQIADAIAVVDTFNAYIETDQAMEEFQLSDESITRASPIIRKMGLCSARSENSYVGAQ